MMRVAFNATALLSPLTGIGQYAYHLAQGLLNEPQLESEFFYATHWDAGIRTQPIRGIAGWKKIIRYVVPKTYSVARALQYRRFASRTRARDFDVYHEPNFLAFPFPGPSVITVHDLSWIRYPGVHPKDRVRAMERYFEPGLRRASVVITDSAFVKQELVDVFGLDPKRIQPVLLGVDGQFVPHTPEQCAAVLNRHQLQFQNYLLAVGTIEPRKNLTLTLQAYARLPATIRARVPLVIAGMSGWHTSALFDQMQQGVAAGQIRVLGYVPQQDLPALVAGSLSLIYPSVYEGFGLPPLEAMACGVPPIVSNVSSIPEVVGDTGLQVDPSDVDGLTQAMQRMIEDSKLRDALALQARERAAAFTWRRTVAETISVYRRAVQSK